MIDDAAILYPSVVMAVFSIALVLALGIRRFLAVRNRKVDGRYYRTFDGGEGEPPSLRRHSRNVQNQFELPPLFHLAVWGTYAAGDVSFAAVIAAWFFVASRFLHSYIHISYNHVLHRFMVFGLGALAVLYLWITLGLSLLA